MSMLLEPQLIMAFCVTILAGLATVIGGALVLYFKKPNFRMLAFGLAFAAGAMIYVSLTEILNKSITAFSTAFDDRLGFAFGTFAFLAGVILILILDRCVPNPHETLETLPEQGIHRQQLLRTGLLTFLPLVHIIYLKVWRLSFLCSKAQR